MANINKKNKIKRRRRIFFFFFLCLVINISAIYYIGSIFKEVHQKKIETKELSSELVSLKDEEDVLNPSKDFLKRYKDKDVEKIIDSEALAIKFKE